MFAASWPSVSSWPSMTCLSWSAEPSVGSPNAVATCRRYAPVSRFELSGSDRPRGTRSCSRAPEAWPRARSSRVQLTILDPSSSSVDVQSDS